MANLLRMQRPCQTLSCLGLCCWFDCDHGLQKKNPPLSVAASPHSHPPPPTTSALILPSSTEPLPFAPVPAFITAIFVQRLLCTQKKWRAFRFILGVLNKQKQRVFQFSNVEKYIGFTYHIKTFGFTRLRYNYQARYFSVMGKTYFGLNLGPA